LGQQCKARDVFNEIVELAASSAPIGTSTTCGGPSILTGYRTEPIFRATALMSPCLTWGIANSLLVSRVCCCVPKKKSQTTLLLFSLVFWSIVGG